MRIKDYDEPIDTLIRNVLMEEQGNYEVSDEVQEKINKKIKEKMEKMKGYLD